MTNISSMEIAELRPFFSTALHHLQTIQAQPHHRAEDTATPGAPEAEPELAVRHATSVDRASA